MNRRIIARKIAGTIAGKAIEPMKPKRPAKGSTEFINFLDSGIMLDKYDFDKKKYAIAKKLMRQVIKGIF